MRLKFALVLSFLAVCGICLAKTKQSDEQDLGQFVERYDNAWNHKDAATIERILAPDYVYFSSKGQSDRGNLCWKSFCLRNTTWLLPSVLS